MKRRLNFFDFDGTLTKRNSFPQFIAFTSGYSTLLRSLPKLLFYLASWICGTSTAKQGKERILSLFYKNWSNDRMNKAGADFADHILNTGLRPGALKAIQSVINDGGRVIIVSASPAEWIRPFAEKVGVEYICTHLLYDAKNCFTGLIADKNCNGIEKVRLIREHVPNLADYEIFAFGDSEGDFQMLELASEGNAFYKPFRNLMFGDWFRLLRIPQWLKNGFVFLPLFFSGQMLNVIALEKTSLIFFSFCCGASFIYVLNDLRDVTEDRNHPTKRWRPIASGAILPDQTKPCTYILLLLGFSIAYTINSACLIIFSFYIILNLFYVYIGKERALLDVICIAVGYVLRVLAGIYAIDSPISQWLLIMVFLLAMFLAVGKRWDDLSKISRKEAQNIRPALNGYNREFVLSMLTFLSAINTMCYIIYTMDIAARERLHTEWLFLTAFWVITGNLRYLQIIFVADKGVSPTSVLLRDMSIQFCVVFWCAHLTYIIY